MKLLHLSLSLYILNLAEGAVLSVKSPAETKYTTIQQALDAAKAGDTILIYPGTYAEKLVVSKDSITLQGSSYPSTNPAENTASISFSTSSSTTIDDDHSATLLVTASNFKAYNLNITNGAASESGASVALSSVGQNNGFYALGIHGYQGTFYAHLGSAFIGRSYIQGTVDFVYGRNGNAWFQGCTLGPVKAQGTITSQGRLTGTDDGYFVFDKVKIRPGKNAAPGTKGSVFLGRPWSDYARVVFQNSDEGDVITSDGWKPYTIGQSTRNLLLGEYSNTNADGPRVSWAQNLRSAVGISTILPGYNKWVDSSFVGVAA